MKPRIITDVKSFNVDDLPVNIESFRDWLNNQIDKIPNEFRGNSSISIERPNFDDDAPLRFNINMMRYETEKERKKRETKAQRVKELYDLPRKTKLEMERRQYEKLRKKFENPSS